MVSTAPYSKDSDGTISYQGDDTVTEVMVSDQRRLEMNSPENPCLEVWLEMVMMVCTRVT